MDLDLIKKLSKPAETKIALLVIDGLGGLPSRQNPKTELEAANTPNLDELAEKSICGLQQPVGPGITPGSGPGHLGLFGYNPLKYQVGRGVLAALGINFDLKDQDIAARGNFCTIDEQERITDRRAGRIPTEKNQELCKKLIENINIPGVEVFVETVKEYRTLLVMRGQDLSYELEDTDPQQIGAKPLDPQAYSPQAEKTAYYVKQFIDQTKEILKNEHPANMILLRGFSRKPQWPKIDEVYGLKPAAIAAYPMYRGVARLAGMNVLQTGLTLDDEFTTLEENWEKYDFFYIHAKKSDSAGEDGDFERKVHEIEKVDQQLPRLLDLNPDVIIVSGDHSTPYVLKAHSWHPVPVLIYSEHCRVDDVKVFGERECMKGGLGTRFPAEDLMPLAMANAERLEKFGA